MAWHMLKINQSGAKAKLIVKETSLDHGGKDTPSLTSYEKERIFDGLSLGAKERGLGLIWSKNKTIRRQKHFSPSQKLGTARATIGTAVPPPRAPFA
ncbi:hypothetical protein MTR_6g471400 [Medicago truncatula]|uniref:Uncharacterized protein n=1 Tax=Medicago truncatula TaxID=3880 RepID=A0A072UA96_MEDTR|nr:hypothetical protein MTR_6g471400 [Medicago truncatula]